MRPSHETEFFRELCDEATTSIERVKEVVPGVSQWGDIQCASRCRPADRTKVPFAAVHESALGTKRTDRGKRARVRFRSEADMPRARAAIDRSRMTRTGHK